MATPQNYISAVENFVKEELSRFIERVRHLAKLLTDSVYSDLTAPGQHLFQKSELNEAMANFPTENIKFMLDKEVIEIAALLHDIGDIKYANFNMISCETFLTELKYPKKKQILFITDNLSYRKELSQPNLLADSLSTATKDEDVALLLSLAIVQDADRLDAIGAIGKTILIYLLKFY
jgi:HD domain